MTKELHIYLPQNLLDGLAAGKGNPFFRDVRDEFEDRGFKVDLRLDGDRAREESKDEDAYALFFQKPPTHDRALVARWTPVRWYWRIEKSVDRHEFRTFNAKFDPKVIPKGKAERFYKKIKEKFAPDVEPISEFKNSVLVAMQGRLLRQRSWQSCTPIEMIEDVAKREKDRQVLVKLHPNEVYSDREIAAINKLAQRSNIRIVDEDLQRLLMSCDYTVSQNSTVSFTGLLYQKPSILYGHAEFHHPFQCMYEEEKPNRAFNRVMRQKVHFEKYVYWFLEEQNIHIRGGKGKARMIEICRELGWVIPD